VAAVTLDTVLKFSDGIWPCGGRAGRGVGVSRGVRAQWWERSFFLLAFLH
jgi:hypothetical protein